MLPTPPLGPIASKRLDLLVFLVAAAAIGLVWLVKPGEWSIEANPLRDYKSFYAPVANNLAEGKGLVTTNGRPATLYPPGYPLMLAALIHLGRWTGISYETWLALFTLTSVALPAVLLFNIAWRILGLRCGLITAALWITYPAALWLSRQPTSDTAFLPFFYAALLLSLPLLLDETDSPLAAAGVGAMLGIAVLIRPIAMLTAPVVALCLAYYGSRESWWRRLRPGLALLVGFGAMLLPWELWMWQRTGNWAPISTNGPASITDGLRAPVSVVGYRRPLPMPAGVRLILEEARDLHAKWRLRTREEILVFLGRTARNRPLQLMQLIWWKAKRAWYGTDSQGEEETWVAWAHGAYLLCMAGGMALLWSGPEGGRRWLVVSGLLVLNYWAMIVVVLSITRYMMPMMGLMFVWQAALLERGWELWRRRRETPRRPPGP